MDMAAATRGARKPLVENALTISIADLMRKGALIPGHLNRGQWSWLYPGEEPQASLGYGPTCALSSAPLCASTMTWTGIRLTISFN